MNPKSILLSIFACISLIMSFDTAQAVTLNTNAEANAEAEAQIETLSEIQSYALAQAHNENLSEAEVEQYLWVYDIIDSVLLAFYDITQIPGAI